MVVKGPELLKPNTPITAAHCVFDWRNAMGPAGGVRAYVGYHGRHHDLKNEPSLQIREGARVCDPEPWITSHNRRFYDYSVVKLDNPFDVHKEAILDVAPTPVVGAEVLDVVGKDHLRRGRRVEV